VLCEKFCFAVVLAQSFLQLHLIALADDGRFWGIRIPRPIGWPCSSPPSP
jgi:hypothetical protein